MVMKENKLLLENAENGVIIKSWVWEDTDKHGNKEYSEHKEVIERNASFDEDSFRKMVTRTLENVAEFLGYNYDKWAKNNLRIDWDLKGRKVEDEGDNNETDNNNTRL